MLSMLNFFKRKNKSTKAAAALSSPVLFVHIPKTAGTSFRISLASELGASSIQWDYGTHSSYTSDLVQQYVYHNKTIDDFLLHMRESNIKAIAGHFHAQKYVPPISLDNVISFVREPIARTLSNYRHYKREFSYEGTLAEFLQTPGACNVMSRYFNGLPWPMFGFIGISERYDESLALLNDKFGWSLTEKKLNTAPAKQVKITQPSPQEMELLKEANAEDLSLYDNCSTLINWRNELNAKSLPFTRGFWRFRPEHGDIIGSATTDNNRSVELLITYQTKSGSEKITATANEKAHAPLQKLASNSNIHFCLPEISIEQVESLNIINASTQQPIIKI